MPSSPSAKTTARRRERRIQIVDIAAQLFAEKGYHGTGVAEICDKTGLGKGSLYYHIESKENLLHLIHDRVMDEVLESAENIRSLDVDASNKLRMLGTDLVRIIADYPDHVWVFLHEWRNLSGGHKEDFRKRRRRYEDAIESIFQDGVEEGTFEIRDTRTAVLAWLGMHNYTYQWYRKGGRLNPMQLAHEFFVVFSKGISAE